MRALVSEARVARLATLDPRDRLHVVPVCFALSGDTLYSAVDQKPKTTQELQRLDNIRSHPEVAVLVDHYEEDWTRIWWVRIRGSARVLEEHDQARRLLSAKYEQYREAPPRGPVIVVDITEWRAWSP